MWSNYHAHSNYCDGKSSVADYGEKGKAGQLISFGISSHAPLPFACKWCMKPDKLTEYMEVLQFLKSESTAEVYAGLEVDYIPGVIGPRDFAPLLDYTIGSIHFVDALPEGTRWEIDGTHAFFREGFEKIFKSNIRDTLYRYFELTREMMTTSCPDIVGHLDKIKIQNINGELFDERDTWYQQEVKRTVDSIASAGAIIEVNTRGLYQKKSATPYPSPWILEYIHQKNIPVTLSSDAHHADDVVNQFPLVAEQLYQIGFRTLMVLYNAQWTPFPFNTHGITFP